jgi:hypothetical protein
LEGAQSILKFGSALDPRGESSMTIPEVGTLGGDMAYRMEPLEAPVNG